MAEETIDLSKLIKGDPKNIIAYADATAKLEVVLESLASVVKTNKSEFDTLKKTLGSSNQVTQKQIDLIKKVAKEFEGLVNKSKANTQATSALEKAKKRLNTLYTEEGKLLVETQQKISARRKEVKDSIQAEDLHSSSLVRMRQRLNEARKEFDRLSDSERKAKTQGGLLRKEIQSLDANIRKLEYSTGRMQRNVGNYTRSVKDAIGAQTGFNLSLSKTQIVLGIVAVAIARLFRNFVSFEKQNAKLEGVLNATNEEMVLLKENSQELGRTTAFTATEVSQLQTELAKLGFTAPEIVNATEGILNLAIASGTDLANAAEIAGTTLRGLGLETTQTDKVVNIMTKSFTTSALDINKWKESIKYVAPIAREAGVSVEELSALMGTLADAGISGSQAGTALRRILTKIGETGKPVGEALKEMADEGLNLADANDEVGRTAQTALLVLTKNVDKIEDLTKQYQNSGNAAKDLADKQLKTLAGQITLLTSALDGFLLSLENGDGILANFAKSTVSTLTEGLNFLSTLDSRFDLFFNGVSNASEETRQAILKLGETDSGKKVADVLNEAFSGVSNTDFLKDLENNRTLFINTLLDEGESLQDVFALWDTYHLQRLEAYSVDKQAAEDALKASRELEENRLNQIKEGQSAVEELKNKVILANQEINQAVADSIKVASVDTIEQWEAIFDEMNEKRKGKIEKDSDGFFQLLGIDPVKYEEEKAQFDENQEALKDGSKVTDQYRKSTKKSNEELAKMGLNAISSAKNFEEGVKRISAASRDKIKSLLSEIIINQIAKIKLPPPFGLLLATTTAAGFKVLFDKYVPQFRKGTPNAPEGPAIVNEEGQEAYLTRKGEFGLLGSGKGGAEMVNLEGGTQVFTAKETNDIISNIMSMQERKAFAANVNKGLKTVKNKENHKIVINHDISDKKIELAIQKGIALGLSKQTVQKTIVSERGVRIMTEKGNQRVIQQAKDNRF